MYVVTIRKVAQKKLLSLPERQRHVIAEAISKLRKDPDDACLDIKKLSGRSEHRMRIGSWRIIYERNDFLGLISIKDLGSRGDVYK